MPDNQALPPLPAWQARSFWLTIIAAASSVGAALGFDLLAFFGVQSDAALADHIMQIVAAVAVVWAWLERRAPNFRLTLSK